LRVIFTLLALILLVWLLIQTEPVQNWMVRKVTKRLSDDLNTEVNIKHVSFALFNRMNLEGTLIRDIHKDTLLYADQVKVRITDWFFLKDELVLKYVGLDDAYINFNRSDSTWNYQFIADYFSPSSPTPKKKSSLKLDLKKVDLKNVRFIQNDLWVGQKMEIKLGSLQLDAEAFDLSKKVIRISELDIDRPFFAMTDFEGRRPPRVKKKRTLSDTDMYFNQGDMTFYVKRMNLKNGTFISDKSSNLPLNRHFDGEHIRFEKITGSITDFTFIKDTMRANIDLATKERSGFELKKLKAQFRLTPQIMEFAKLDLVTPKSRLQNYYSMKFTDFNEDFKHYVHEVTMESHFVNSELHSDDIAFFAPELKTWNRSITLWGNAKGTVENLSVKKAFIRIGTGTTLSGDLAIVGLPDVNQTIFSLQSGDLHTTYRDAITFVPAIAKVEIPSISSLGNVQFRGNFNGKLRDFKTAGNFSTNLGSFSTDIAMKLPAGGVPSYSGKVVTKQFNVGKFLAIKDMGNVTFDGNVKGVGLELAQLRTTVTGNIQQLAYNDYLYKNINVEGTFQRKQFEGTVKIDDPNLNLFTTVKMDLRNAEPQFNVLGDLANSNFQKLNFANRQLEISGLFDLNFAGKNIDQFLGSVKVYNANLLHEGVRLNFDSLSLQSGFESGRRLLSLTSNEFAAKIEGVYNIFDLPDNFQVFLHKYYPAYINEPKHTPKDQKFTFEVSTKNVEGYTQLLDKNLTGFSNSRFTGSINTYDTLLEMTADVPSFSYKKYKFNDISIAGRGDLNALSLDGDIGNIYLADSTNFPNTTINIVSQKDISQVSLHTKAENTLNELNLNAEVGTFSDGVKIKFNPSDFVINDKRWTLEKEGEIVIRKNFVSADNVRFTQGDQVIEAETRLSEEFDQTDLVVKLNNINIGDFAPLIVKDPRLEGTASGNVVLRDFFGDFRILANLKAEQFRLDNDSVGIVNIRGGYNRKTGAIRYHVESPNELYNFLAEGTYNLADSVNQPLSVDVKLNHTKINFLNKFLSSVFTDVQGLATGNITLSGNPKHPILTGRTTIKDASLFVNFTKVRYFIDSATFVFEDDKINFGNFILKDKYNNTANASGIIYEKGFENIRYDFDLNTSKLLLIDTKANDNSSFYGTAIGEATLSLAGPQENLRMNITAEPVDSSHIYIPTTNTRESAEADFIKFKQYGTEMKASAEGSATNVIVDLDLTANPLAKIDVILDEITGDIIKANGDGRLRIHAGTNESLTINGRYEIQRGSYDFNFQSFIKKPFDLREGAGSFIEWNGDPYNAKLKVEATYTAENVRLGDLIVNQNFNSTARSYKDKVFVVAEISGDLKQPKIKFRFEFPVSGQQVLNDPTFAQFLSKLQRDDNEMLKQVTYLLVFGSFAPYGEGRNIATNFTTLGYNTISEMVSKQVNRLVSNLLYEIFKDRSLQFDVSTSVYNSSSLFSGNVTATNTNSIDRQQVNFKLSKGLFNNNVVVSFGGDLDFKGIGSNTVSTQQLGALQWLPDIAVEIILSKDRRIRAILFSRNNLDITGNAVGRRSRQGASISYRRDFNNFFGPGKQKDPQNNTPKQPADSSKAVLPDIQYKEKKTKPGK
jgi:hypothetical protein